MMKHKPMCMAVTLLIIVGGINWGLQGLGMLIGQNLNVVNRLLGSWPTVEAIVYLLVGLAGLAYACMFVTMKDCACQKMDK